MDNNAALIHMDMRRIVETTAQEILQSGTNCPWLIMTINQFSEELEVWHEQPGTQTYLVCKKPLMGQMQLTELIAYVNSISQDGSGETMLEKIQRQTRERERVERNALDAQIDAAMPAVEKFYDNIRRNVLDGGKTVY